MWNRNASGNKPPDDNWVWVNAPSQQAPPPYSPPQPPQPSYGLNINISGVPCSASTYSTTSAQPPSQYPPARYPPYPPIVNTNLPGSTTTYYSPAPYPATPAYSQPHYASYASAVNANIPGSAGSYYNAGPVYDWISCRHFDIPPNAIKCGHDVDGKQIFVGKSSHKGDELPCKVVPERRQAYVSYDGRETSVDDFKILVVSNRVPRWLPDRNGQVPSGAIPGGRTRTGELLYVGRTKMAGGTVVGKIHPSHRCLYVPFGGKEVSYKEYEVLVL